MWSTVLDKPYDKHERAFLTWLARDCGWINSDAIILVERMRYANNYLSNASLGEELGFDEQKVADTLSRKIFPLLESKGAPKKPEGLKKKHWDKVQLWLKEELFPKWVKPVLWDEMWLNADFSDRIKIEVEGLATAGCVRRPIDIVQIPKIQLGKNIEYHVSIEDNQELILLEMDGHGQISCLSPSAIFPKFSISEPVAREKLLAVVTQKEPQISWLAEARQDLMEIGAAHLQELMVWVERNPGCHLWQSQFDIVASEG